jgi:hypothetical protein
VPFNSVLLKPGVNTQATPLVNEAGVSQSQLIRYKDGMIQSDGGWVNYGTLVSPSTVRDIHAWQTLAGTKYLGIGATHNLLVYRASTNTIIDITPQITTNTDILANINFSITSGSNVVTVNDPNSGASVYNTVYFNTPITIGSVFLSGAYPVQAVLSTGSFTINASANSTISVISSGILPVFTLTNNSAIVSVLSPYSYYLSVNGLFYPFIAPTFASSTLTIQGNYQINQIISTAGSSYTYTIGLTQAATGSYSVTMSSGSPQLVYYITGSPAALGLGFGGGPFGGSSSITSTGPYIGFGGTAPAGGLAAITGTPIVTTDWSLDNWGDILLACPSNGPVYFWSDSLGITTAEVVSQAPFSSGGLFISQPQQILVLWRSDQITGAQNNLRIDWSNALDYTNWTISNQTTAGGFQIPSGSIIVGGMQGPTYAMISTDIEVWQMQYVGGVLIFQFTKIGSGCGWIGQHAAGVLGGTFYWCGINNFYMAGPSGVTPMPCSVWDIIFQNINPLYQTKVKCAVNSAFSEITWFYPSILSAGENDSYVRVTFDTTGQAEWSYGSLPRTAWTDISVLGFPIGPDTSGTFYQHETGVTHPGASAPSFQTGWWSITEGHDLAFVDLIIPDFVWGLRSGAQDAQMNLTFFSANYPGDTPLSYGPYTVTQATEYINVRIRGRLMSVRVQSANNEFFRLGRVRYRFAPSGQR